MRVSFAAVAFALLVTRPLPAAEGPQLPGTQPLTLAGDIASQLVDGVDRFLLREIETSQAAGESLWRRDFSSPEAYRNSIAAQRARLARFLGLRDSRPKFAGFERLDTVRNAGPAARSETYEIFPIRWRAFGDVYARGLLLKPTSDPPKAFVVALPDADVSPEQLVGLAPGVPEASQYARRLAEAGCYVVVPTLIDRMPGDRRCPHGDRKVVLTTREFLYRSAFELGRHPLGYELQMVFGALDGFDDEAASQSLTVPYGVFGWGEGGLVAMYAAALDERIAATVVSGAFDDRREMWKAPLDRNVFGLLTQFGDADTASMILPRALIVEAAVGPQVVVAPGGAGGPGSLATPPVERVRSEFARLQKLGSKLGREGNPLLVESDNGAGPYASEATRHAFAKALGIGGPIASKPDEIEVLRSDLDVDVRRKELTHEIVRHHELLLRESPYVRQEFMKRLNTSSIPAYNESARPYRDYFYNEVMGRFSHSLLPPNPRSRIAFESETCIAYEVTLDVFPDVIAYGVLLTPKGLKTDERRPVVVCQHGLEGRPMDVIAGDHYAYHDYATKLAERGFVVFAPQNLYLFRDRFRTLQRKANPLQKTLFSIIAPQHQQIVDWLQSLPFVDPDRIAFYGLSYGGKTAMRVPALVEDYALSICSADFNDWIEKNASTTSPQSYVWTDEYEIFEFDLANTFNYAEMAALIAPRPFMVERGHFDGVGTDDAVGREFGRVLNLHQARLKLTDHCCIEWFDGPHTINGKGTFEFLHEKLKSPAPLVK